MTTTAPGPARPGPARRGSRAPQPGGVPLVRAASRRALAVALTVAALLHVPLLPTPLLGWIELLMSLGSGELADYDAGETIIPLDLDLLAEDPSAADQGPATAPGDTAGPAEPGGSVHTPSPEAALDAGVDAAPAAVDAGAPADDAGLDDPYATSETPDAGVEMSDGGAEAPDAEPGPADAGAAPPSALLDGGAPAADAGGGAVADGGQPKLRDPLSVAGNPGKIASKDPNVQVLIAGDRLRSHDLGATFGRILTTIPEWQSFFKDTAIDPIRDIDHMLLAGPQFRDTRKVVVVMEYRTPEPAMRAAVDVIVQRAKGSWIKGAPVPAARAKVERGERIFALVPNKRLLVVLPGDQGDQLSKLNSLKSFNKSSSVGIVLSMLTPANAFRKLYKLPTSLKWLRLTVTPVKDGAADVALTVGDASAGEAAEHARELTRVLNALRTIDLGITKLDVIDEVRFEATGDEIWAKVHVTAKQLKLIMGFVEQAMKDQAQARENRKKGTKVPAP